MEQTAIQTNDIYSSFLTRRRQPSAIAKQPVPAQGYDTFSSSEKKPEKSFLQKYWGGLVAGTIGAAGAVTGAIMLVKSRNMKQAQKELKIMTFQVQRLGNKVSNKRTDFIKEWVKEQPPFIMEKIIPSCPVESMQDHINSLVEETKAYDLNISNLKTTFKKEIRPMFTNPEVKEIRDFRRNIEREMRKNCNIVQKDLDKNGKLSCFDEFKKANYLSIIRAWIYDAMAVKSGKLSINKFEYYHNDIKFEDFLSKMKQSKNLPVEDIFKTFSKELEIPEQPLTPLKQGNASLHSAYKKNSLTLGRLPHIKYSIGVKTPDIKSLSIKTPGIGFFLDSKLSKIDSDILTKILHKPSENKILTLQKSIENFGKFETEELIPKLNATEEMKALREAEAKLADLQNKVNKGKK